MEHTGKSHRPVVVTLTKNSGFNLFGIPRFVQFPSTSTALGIDDQCASDDFD